MNNEISMQLPFNTPNPFDALSVEQFKEHLKNREIWINGPITERLVDTLYMNLINLNSASNSIPITVMINSLGGNLFESFVATDMMATIQAPITTVALANICSGGFILFMGGKHRVIHENTNIMIHSAGFSTTDKIPMISEHLNYLKLTMDRMEHFFETQTGVPYKFWKEIVDSGKERYFTAEEALKLRIAHQIIGRPKPPEPRKPYTWDLAPTM